MSISKNVTTVMTAAVFGMMLFVVCDNDDVVKPDNNGGENLPFKIAEVNTPQPLIAPLSSGLADPVLRVAATGANDFAFRLGAALMDAHAGENFVVSPYSVWMPLAALANAAAHEHIDALLTSLGSMGITIDDINRAASRMLYDLTNNYNGHNPLQIVNAIFVDNTVTLRREFAQTYADYYRGGAINVDFSSQEAVTAVNNWAAENTNGLITNLIQQFDPQTVAAIANAIYFSDRWESEFDPAQTQEGDFHAPSGITKAQFMKRDSYGHNYYEDDAIQSISISFRSGGGMRIILPKPDGASVEEIYSSITSEYFNTINRGIGLSSGELLLPRFSIENSINLVSSLSALGVPLFELNSIVNLIEEDNLMITDAIQRALINVDEKGTTAAAVTVIAMAGSGAPQPPIPFEMICDRPFMFVLYDRTREGGSQILFTGIVNQP